MNKMNNINMLNLTNDYNITINNIIIDSSIFDEEKVDYRVLEREELINDLIGWIGEGNKDKELMKEDLIYLMKQEDKYIFSSILTNEYILKSDNKEEFNNICSDILKLNEGVSLK